MSTSMINPVEDLVGLNTLGGFDTALNPAARVFMITEDKAITLVNGSGRTRTYPAGTFTTKTFYPMIIQKVKSGTAAGSQSIFLGFDRPQA